MLFTATTIDPQTLRAYRETEYRVLGDRPFAMRIDETCPALAALHARHGVSCSAFVTACNPHSLALSAQENLARQAELAHALAVQGGVCLPGLGILPDGTWPGEDSFLVLGLARDAAGTLGRRFGQNAIVWASTDAIPRLILLR